MTKLESAKRLALDGFKVFPIAEGLKAPPLIKNFPTVATSDLAVIIRWWECWPKANVGIHCEDLIVLDVDAGKGGYESLLTLEMERGNLPATMEVSTPSGGKHIYYRHKGGIKNGVNVLGPGLDIRSNSGYVLAPGSAVSTGNYSYCNAVPIERAPEWMGRLQPAAKPVTVAPENVDPTGAAAIALEFLRTHPPAVEGEGGDHYTFVTICYVRDFGVSEADAWEVLYEWNSRCSPPWSDTQLQRKIHNAYNYAQNAPGTKSVEAMFDIVPETPPSISNEQDEELYTPDDVILSSVLKSGYLIKGWIEKGAQGLLFGHWGSGKTFIALHLAAHLAAGQPWFGNKVKPGGVLYFGYEGSDAMKKRIYALRKEFPLWQLDTFMVRPMRWPLVRKHATAQPKGQAYVERALEAYKKKTGSYPALVVIDPLRNALGGSDSDPDLTAPFLGYLQKITKVTGCATLTIHHPGHVDSDRSRGDSGIEAHMDTVIKVDGERGSIEAKKQRDDPKGAMFYKLKIVELGRDADGDMKTTCVAEQVQDNPLDPSLTDQQKRIYDRAAELAGEGGLVTKTILRQASPDLDSTVRKEIVDALITKRYLVPAAKNQWTLGLGAAEMFD